MYSASDLKSSALFSEEVAVQHWLRRLWPVYCVLAALVTFGYALFDPYQVDGDAVAYMDIGDLMRSHQWSAVVNGYWNPLYPAALSIGHTLFHSNRYNELHAYYMVNFGIFLLEMLAVIAFTGALAQLRDLREAAVPEKRRHGFLLDRYALGYLGIGILIVATQRELSLGKVRPDALLLAFLLLAIAALMKYLATNHLRYAALMGVALGLAYLTKSFAFVFTLLCVLALIAFRIFWQRQLVGRVAASAALVVLCFSAVAGPYIAALSKQKGHFDFGDSGSLNYIWFVSGTEKMHLEPDMTSSFGSAEVHLKHPETRLLKSPPTYSFTPFSYGTYPVWFDASYFNDHIKARMDLRLQIVVIGQSIVRILRYMSNHPEAWIILLILLFAGGRLYPNWRLSENAFWLVPTLLGVAALCVYGIVNVEDRYLTAAFFTLLVPVFAAMRVSSEQTLSARTGAAVAIALFALLAVGESARIIGQLRRDQITAQNVAGWYNHDIFNAAHALNELGVGPGDTVACIGTRACVNDHYWARLAGVRILSEIYVPNPPLSPYLAAIPNRDEAYEAVRSEGGKVLVGFFETGSSPASDGWRELNGTPYYVLPLNLPVSSTDEKGLHQACRVEM
jgi:hypothetical protein